MRVLKLVQYGGSGAKHLGEVSPEDMAGLGEDFDMDTDLGSYAKKAPKEDASSRGSSGAKERDAGGYSQDISEDDIPF